MRKMRLLDYYVKMVPGYKYNYKIIKIKMKISSIIVLIPFIQSKLLFILFVNRYILYCSGFRCEIPYQSSKNASKNSP